MWRQPSYIRAPNATAAPTLTTKTPRTSSRKRISTFATAPLGRRTSEHNTAPAPSAPSSNVAGGVEMAIQVGRKRAGRSLDDT